MRIRVSHQTVYAYDTPAKALIQTLRLTPRNHDGQFVVNWRIEVDVDGRLRQGEDAFGNITHQLSVSGPVGRVTVSVEGEVETHDTTGIVRGTLERFPPELYLRETDATRADPGLRALAEAARGAGGGDMLAALHALMGTLHATVSLDPAAPGLTRPDDVLAAGSGTAADLAHLFVAGARHLGVPARFVSGYLCAPAQAGVVHAWAEALAPGIGWIAFDPGVNLCPVGAHVRVAIGLDYWGAAPVRGTRYGGDGERLDVKLRVEPWDQAQRQNQN